VHSANSTSNRLGSPVAARRHGRQPSSPGADERRAGGTPGAPRTPRRPRRGDGARQPGRGRRTRSRRHALIGVAFVAPALAFLTVLMLVPLALAVKDAFYEDDITTTLSGPRFIGLQNFRTFFRITEFSSSLLITVQFVVAATAGAFVLGLIWAVVLESIKRGRIVLRSVTLVSWILPSVVTAFLWAWIFNGQFGVLNGITRGLRLTDTNIAWLAYPFAAKSAIVIARVWQSMPWFVLMFLAGMQTVPTDLVEAVRTDGGSNWAIVRHVIIPHMNFTMVLAIMLGAMGNLQLFDLIYAMTGGGPAGATSVMSLSVYQQAFQVFDTGMAATIGVIWVLTLVIPAAIYVRATMPSKKRQAG
jgi:multiple sugar transport system permease protein